jgi:hypothetical protein
MTVATTITNAHADSQLNSVNATPQQAQLLLVGDHQAGQIDGGQAAQDGEADRGQ